MARRRIPKATWREARRLWTRGELAATIASRLRVTPSAVYWHRIAEGWPAREPVARRAIDWPRVRALWDAGQQGQVIAAQLGLNAKTVYNHARRAGWPRRRHPNARTEAWAQARLRWEAGEPTAQIAANLGVATRRVHQYASQHQWPRRRPVLSPKPPKAPKPTPRAPRSVDKPKVHPCSCGSYLARPVFVEGLLVRRCSTCQPERSTGRAA